MKRCLKVPLCCLFTLACLLVGAGVGSVPISLGDQVAILLNKLFGCALPERIEANLVSIYWVTRLPRVCMAALVGAALSASGTVMQSVLRNPLASSYTLGVSAGASLGAACVIMFHINWLGTMTLPFAGFVAGLFSVFLAIALTLRADRGLSGTAIILSGMVLSLFVNALLTLVTALSLDHLKQLVFWQMGSFSGQRWKGCAFMAPLLAACLLLIQSQTREMDLLTFGDEQAMSAGVPVRRVKFLLIVITSLLTGAAVSFTGIIGFVDLVVPHLTRRLFGSRHKVVVPMSALLGAGALVLADLTSRTLLNPPGLPVGAVTALIGAPFFAYVYFRKRREEA